MIMGDFLTGFMGLPWRPKPSRVNVSFASIHTIIRVWREICNVLTSRIYNYWQVRSCVDSNNSFVDGSNRAFVNLLLC